VCRVREVVCEMRVGRTEEQLLEERVAKKRREEARAARGLCVQCAEPNNGSAKRCIDCSNRASSQRFFRIKLLRSSGKCSVCGSVRDGVSKLCSPCKKKRVDDFHRRLKAGVCVSCSGPRDRESNKCSACYKLVKDRKAEKVKQGLCASCYKARDGLPGTCCETCILKMTAHRWLRSRNRWIELKEIFDSQSGSCFYTGQAIRIGVDATLDHRTPRSRGGSFEIDNLQWVSERVNLAKRALMHDEFIQLCTTIAGRFREKS